MSWLDDELKVEGKRVAFYAGDLAGKPCPKGATAKATGCIPASKMKFGAGGAMQGPITPRQAAARKGWETRRKRMAEKAAAAKSAGEAAQITADLPADDQGAVDLSGIGKPQLDQVDKSPEAQASAGATALATAPVTSKDIEAAGVADKVAAVRDEMSSAAAEAGFTPSDEDRANIGKALEQLPEAPPAQQAKQRMSAVRAAVGAGAKTMGSILAWCGKTAAGLAGRGIRAVLDAGEVGIGAVRMAAYAVGAPHAAIGVGLGSAAFLAGMSAPISAAAATAVAVPALLTGSYMMMRPQNWSIATRGGKEAGGSPLKELSSAFYDYRGAQMIREGLSEAWGQLTGRRGWADVDIGVDTPATEVPESMQGGVTGELASGVESAVRQAPSAGKRVGRAVGKLARGAASAVGEGARAVGRAASAANKAAGARQRRVQERDAKVRAAAKRRRGSYSSGWLGREQRSEDRRKTFYANASLQGKPCPRGATAKATGCTPASKDAAPNTPTRQAQLPAAATKSPMVPKGDPQQVGDTARFVAAMERAEAHADWKDPERALNRALKSGRAAAVTGVLVRWGVPVAVELASRIVKGDLPQLDMPDPPSLSGEAEGPAANPAWEPVRAAAKALRAGEDPGRAAYRAMPKGGLRGWLAKAVKRIKGKEV